MTGEKRGLPTVSPAGRALLQTTNDGRGGGPRFCSAVLALTALLAACGGAGDVPADAVNHADHIVIAGDPGAADPATGADLPRDDAAAGDPAATDGPPADLPFVDPGDATDVPDTELEDADLPGDPAGPDDGVGEPALDMAGDPEPLDLPADELPAAELPPVDAGHEVAVGACAPGDASCWCTNDSHCNPSYSVPCLPNACDAATGHCALDKTRQEGDACNDGDACTSPDACHDGACTAGPWICQCKTDAECDDLNLCTDDHCTAGTCQHPANAAPCDDGHACTGPDACSGWHCVGGPKICECETVADCDDHEVCTLDACGADHACTHTAQAGACDDGNACTGPDTCSGGHCVAGPVTCECQVAGDCNDGEPCTDDSCVANHCQHAANTLACDDGDPLTVGDHCGGGHCLPGIKCGDGACNGTETCQTCPGDCGACPTVETNCGDGIDNDFDGMTDCQDPDCGGKSPCPTDACSGNVAHVFTCGGSAGGFYNTLHKMTGTTCGDKLGNYWNSVFRFDATATQSVQFKVTNTGSGQFRLYLMDYVCAAAACVSKGCCDNPTVTLNVVAGASYFIAVADYDGNDPGQYTVSVTCL